MSALAIRRINLKRTYQWILAAVAFAALAGCDSKSSPAILTVNDEDISTDQLYRYLATKPTVRINTASGVVEAQVAERLDFQALQDMIGQRIVLQLAKDEGVFPGEDDVKKEIAFRQSLNPNYTKQLTDNGITLEQIKENLTLELAREKLLTKGLTVTMEEVEKYIAENPNEFTEPAKAELLYVLVTGDAKKKKVDEEIGLGQTFSAIAAEYSETAEAKENGGRYNISVVSQMPEQIQKLITNLEPGARTDWLQVGQQWAKFYVQSKTPARKMELTAERKELVRRQVAQKRGAEAIDLPKRVIDKITQSKIKVSHPALRQAWETAFERLKREAGTGLGTGGSVDPTAPGGTTGQ